MNRIVRSVRPAISVALRPAQPAVPPRLAAAIGLVWLLTTTGSVAWADTYPRQPGVDAWHYAFHLTVSDTSPNITAQAIVDLRMTQDGISAVTLDLASAAGGKGMTVSSVTSAGRSVPYVHQQQSLQLSLFAPSTAGQHVRFTIAYHGVPARGLQAMKNKYGEWCAFSDHWPNHARAWLPMIDHPYDKATSEFFVTAPATYQVIANGLLEDERDLPGGLRLTHWKQSVPISSWLNTVGIERFAVHRVGLVKNVELQTWVAHQDDEIGRVYFETPARQALEFFSERIGPYPYEKLANVAAAGVNGGTEYASAIFYGERGLRPAPATGLVAHEIAHQWFGNSVTQSDWDEVWLSEGFATYFTLLYTEHFGGRDAFVAGLQASRSRAIATEKALPGISVIYDNLADMDQVLNQLVYQKAGWVLHMLRGVIGTDTFWSGIRDYYRQYRDRNASTADLRRVMEDASGQELGWFFEQWLRRPASPSFAGSWSYDAATKQVQIELNQTQAGAPYRVTVEIAIVAEPGRPATTTRVERLELTAKHHVFDIAAATAPAALVFDPNTWLLTDTVIFIEKP